MDLALNNLQRLICHKTQQTKPRTDYLHKKWIWRINNLQRMICHKTQQTKPRTGYLHKNGFGVK